MMMHSIPATAFEKPNIYTFDKVTSVLHNFTPMHVSVEGQDHPQLKPLTNQQIKRIDGRIFGIPDPATIQFGDDRLRIVDSNHEVISTESLLDIDFVQFGILKLNSYRSDVPIPHYFLAVTVQTSDHAYYILNSDFNLFTDLTAFLRANRIPTEDPFELGTLTDIHQWPDYLNRIYDTISQQTNYPEPDY